MFMTRPSDPPPPPSGTQFNLQFEKYRPYYQTFFWSCVACGCFILVNSFRYHFIRPISSFSHFSQAAYKKGLHLPVFIPSLRPSSLQADGGSIRCWHLPPIRRFRRREALEKLLSNQKGLTFRFAFLKVGNNFESKEWERYENFKGYLRVVSLDEEKDVAYGVVFRRNIFRRKKNVNVEILEKGLAIVDSALLKRNGALSQLLHNNVKMNDRYLHEALRAEAKGMRKNAGVWRELKDTRRNLWEKLKIW